MEECDSKELLKYYGETVGKFSCQPFILYHLPDKKINMEKLVSEFEGDLKVEQISIDGYKVFDEFKDEHGELFKKFKRIHYYIKEDASFNETFIDKSISYFNCFEEIRYPTPTKKPKEVVGLLEYNDDMKNVFHDTYLFLREKSFDYIRDINQKRAEEREHEYQKLKEY